MKGFTLKSTVCATAVGVGLAALVTAGSTITRAQDKPDLKLCYTTWGQHGGEDLPGKGFIPDLVQRVFAEAGYQVTVDIVVWPRCINGAKKQRYDLVASGWRGENFDPFFEYLNITLRNDINFIVHRDSKSVSGDIEEFSGKTIVYVRDSGGMDDIRQNSSIKTREVSEMVTMIPMLEKRRVDAAITDPESFFLAAAEMDPPVDHLFRILQPPLVTNFNSPLIAKDHPLLDQIRGDFDRSFKKLVKNGIYQELIEIHGPQFEYQVPDSAR